MTGDIESRVGRTGEPDWVRDVLGFWFSELTPVDWWTRSDEIDAQIRARFIGLHERIAAADGGHPDAPRTTLATVIVLDQFPRNMFRNTARAFATDALARRMARKAIDEGTDASLRPEERLFLYLPFEHSENRDDQALAISLITKLGNDEWTRFALAHQSVIERFGRFPHRNAALGRESTPAEIAALREPGNAF